MTEARAEQLRFIDECKQQGIKEGIKRGIKEGKAEGKQEGITEGKAASVLVILDARGLSVTATQRRRILSCQDAATLDRWLVRAVTARRAADLLAD